MIDSLLATLGSKRLIKIFLKNFYLFFLVRFLRFLRWFPSDDPHQLAKVLLGDLLCLHNNLVLISNIYLQKTKQSSLFIIRWKEFVEHVEQFPPEVANNLIILDEEWVPIRLLEEWRVHEEVFNIHPVVRLQCEHAEHLKDSFPHRYIVECFRLIRHPSMLLC